MLLSTKLQGGDFKIEKVLNQSIAESKREEKVDCCGLNRHLFELCIQNRSGMLK